MSADAPNVRPGRAARAVRKIIAVGVRAFTAWYRLAYRLSPPWRGKLGHVDHVTVPCRDLGVAEEFYVGLLGAKVALRLDAARLERLGWSTQAIVRNQAGHLQLTFAGGPHLDLFEYPNGVPSHDAPMHPHVALTVRPSQLLRWKQRLIEHGVVVAGPTRPGPPGQASFYFNDPFGNHLELITVGFTAEELPIGVPDRSGLDYDWQGLGNGRLNGSSTARAAIKQPAA